MDSNKGHYEVLGLDRSAPTAQIERAYQFVRGIYADPALGAQLGPEPAELARQRARIEEAYRVLTNAEERAAYDAALGSEPAAATARVENVGEQRLSRRERRESDRQRQRERLANGSGLRGQQAPIPRKSAVPPPVGPFNGKVLRAYRTARGVTLEQIAYETKIRTHYLESIEADRYSVFPAALYLKGYLQAYCRALGIDGKDVCDSYMSRVTFEEPAIRLGAR